MKAKIYDGTDKFTSLASKAISIALGNMAKDIETVAKVKKVPVDKSDLQSNIEHKKVTSKHYRVEVDKAYARFQEYGGDNKRKVRKYTKPGTGAHYLRDSGEIIVRKFPAYFKAQTQLVKYVKGGKVSIGGKSL
jgi:hypothetical protein